jgi:hypothetical protein
LSAGAQDFIVKPFDPTEVILRIGSLLRLRSMHTQLRRANADLEHKVAARTRELASERQFLSAVLDSLSEAIIATDADGSPRLANPAVDHNTRQHCATPGRLEQPEERGQQIWPCGCEIRCVSLRGYPELRRFAGKGNLDSAR